MNVDVLIELVKSDLKSKYKNAFLGFLWIIFEPLLIMLILYLVFNRFIRFDMPYYPLYLLSGITVWRIFVNSTTGSLTSLQRNRDLVLKVRIKRILLPLSSVCSSVLTGIFEIVIYVLFFAIIKKSIHVEFLLTIPFLFVYSLCLAGISFILSIVYIYIRDIKPAWDVFVQALFFLCPIFYPLSLIPIKYITYYLLNPVAVFIIGFQNILYKGIMPDITVLINSLFFSIIVFIIGIMLFKFLENGMVKRI